MNISEQAYIVLADFHSTIGFFYMNFVIFSHFYCIRICSVLLFGSHCIRFGSTCWWCWTKSKFLLETLLALKISNDYMMKERRNGMDSRPSVL